ncbi:MAG: hypothetical protein A3I66_05035 [Burkholderiales bacterium RIFCSPLOWO2_02_FULL_57_36]|nr:MAG: hypothetical protein A3I66_05035 [Burkholderiales bacterium RIFCSPLOWO2_02_FULL_57_36]
MQSMGGTAGCDKPTIRSEGKMAAVIRQKFLHVKFGGYTFKFGGDDIQFAHGYLPFIETG